MTRIVVVLLIEVAALAATLALVGLIPAEVWAGIGKLAVWAGLTVALLAGVLVLEGRAERAAAKRRNHVSRRVW